MINWSQYKHFKREEFLCKQTGEEGIRKELVDALEEMREVLGFPLNITSGYRSPNHKIEIKKPNRGTHTYGIAVDIGVRGEQAYKLLELAMDPFYFSGIGIKQKGNGRFIHLDMRHLIEGDHPFPIDTIWSY